MNIDIQSGIEKILESKKKLYPQHSNRISALDDNCERRLYYMRAEWDKATPTDDRLAGVFETGTELEPMIQGIVLKVGMAATPRWRIVGTQTTTSDNLLKQYQISGTIDGFLQAEDDGKWITLGIVDIKTASPNIYPALNCYDDLSKYSWTRKYRGQLMLYALAHNMDKCFILFVNKSNLYEMKLIEFPLDMAYAESLLQKADRVNKAIAANQPPAGINDPEECPNCRWFSFCCPDLVSGGNLKIVDCAELEEVLNRLEELKDEDEQIKELVKRRDALLVKGQDIAVGHWMVIWKETKVGWRKSIIHSQPAA